MSHIKSDDLEMYISRRKARDKNFAANFDAGYERFKSTVLRKAGRAAIGQKSKKS